MHEHARAWRDVALGDEMQVAPVGQKAFVTFA
jgi:hypothetical protein